MTLTTSTEVGMTVDMDLIQVPYDVNYCFAVPSVLENDRVKLVPFIVRPSSHGAFHFNHLNQH